MTVDQSETRATVRPRASRRGVRAAIALVGLATLVGLLGCGTLAEVFLFRANDAPLAAPGTVTDGGWRVVAYETADGVTLRGALLERGSDRPTLVWFHGTGDCAANNMARARIVAEGGFNVFLAEYRGYGGCEGSPSEEGLVADGRAALAAVERETGVAEAQVTLVGVSLGTGVVAALAAEGRGRAVVLIAPYTSIRDVVSEYVPRSLARFCVPALFESLPRLRRARQPLLVVHGTADPGVPFAHGQRIVREVGARARLLPLEDAGHDDRFDESHWRRISKELVRFTGA